MKRTILLLIMLSPGLAPLAGSVCGQVDLVSRYVWRGFDLLPDNHAAIQPSFTFDLGKGGFSLNLWGSFALAQHGTLNELDEVDLTLAYAFPLANGWEATLGLTNYGYWFAPAFKVRDCTSQEAVATVAKADWPLSPQLSIYYDFNLGSGLYVALSGSHELKIGAGASLEAGALIGFNSKMYMDKTGFSDIDLYAKVPLAAGKLTLAPSFNVMIPLLDQVNQDAEIWFGLSAAF